MPEDRVTLKQAMKNYSSTMRSNKGKYGEGQGRKKILGMVGDEMMSAAKYYKSAIEPNVKSWKDIESGYDELGIKEADRWGGKLEGEAPGFFQKMKSPEKFEIPDVVSGGYEYSAGSLQALGKATRSPKAEQFLALTKSDKTDFAQLFSIGKSSAVKNISEGGDIPPVSPTSGRNDWFNKETQMEGNVPYNKETKTKMDRALSSQSEMDKAFLELSKGQTLDDIYEEGGARGKSIGKETTGYLHRSGKGGDGSSDTDITQPTTSGMDIDKENSKLVPNELTWKTDKLFNEYWKESQSNVIFSTDISDTQMEINYNAWKKTNAK